MCPRITRASPVIFSEPIGLRLWGIEELPFCPLAKNFVEELKWRGMLAQIMPGTEENPPWGQCLNRPTPCGSADILLDQTLPFLIH